MRVLHFIDSLSTGGAERLVVDLAEAATRRGEDVSIVTLSSNPGIPLEHAQRVGLDVISLDRARADPRIVRDLRSAARGFELVHVHLFPAMYWGASLGCPLVFTEHSTVNRRMASRCWSLPEARVYRRYDEVVAISAGVRDSLTRHLDDIGAPREVPIVHNGVRADFFATVKTRPSEHDGTLRLIGLGSLTTVKNWRFAVEAVQRVPDSSLDIVGEGPLRSSIQKLINSLNLQGRVRLLGSVSDVPNLLQRYDAMVVPSLWEGFSLAAAEGLAVGLPVIASNIAGLREVITDGVDGRLFAPQSLDGAAEAIGSFRDREVLSSASHRARINGKRFSIEDCLASYMCIYRSILEKGP